MHDPDEIITVFRVSGKNFDVSKFLKQSNWNVGRHWVQGYMHPVRKKIADNSGFNYDICTKGSYPKDFEKHIKEIRKFLQKNRIVLKKLKRKPSISEIDIGVIGTESSKVCMYQAHFEPELLKLAAGLGITLKVSVYL